MVYCVNVVWEIFSVISEQNFDSSRIRVRVFHVIRLFVSRIPFELRSGSLVGRISHLHYYIKEQFDLSSGSGSGGNSMCMIEMVFELSLGRSGVKLVCRVKRREKRGKTTTPQPNFEVPLAISHLPNSIKPCAQVTSFHVKLAGRKQTDRLTHNLIFPPANL